MKTSSIITRYHDVLNRRTVSGNRLWAALLLSFILILFMNSVPYGSIFADNGDGGENDDPPEYPVPPAPQGLWKSPSPAANYYGGLHASGIGFQYWNNYMMMMAVTEQLRSVPLVTYTGEGEGTGAIAPTVGGGYGGEYSTGGYDSAPYGPGYAPAYEGQPVFQSGYPVYQDGVLVNPQTSVAGDSALYRGQTAQYGDPGTLIYSLWGGVIGGGGTIKDHADVPGYKTKQYGGLVGLDLFGSCDCRSGLFYGYQQTELKQEGLGYGYNAAQNGTLYNPLTGDLTGVGEEFQAVTAYDYLTNYAGQYNGKLKTNNHLIGFYHQFGSEFIYNIATVRFGYNRVKTDQTISESGTTSGTITDTMITYEDGAVTDPGNPVTITPTSPGSASRTLSGKYNEFIGGVSFERGANFKFMNVLTFTPRGALDYNYLFRKAFDETVNTGGSLHYKKKSYHSLRSNLGADLALDLYPGNQHFRLVGRGSYVHEFLDSIYGKTSLTDFSGAEWSVIGNSTGRDWAIVGAGAEWTIVPAFMIFGNYDFIKNKYVSSHYGDVGLKLMW